MIDPPSSLPGNISPVDIAILVVIGLFAVGGLRRGFVLGFFDLVAFGLALVAAVRLAPELANPLRAWGLPNDLAEGAGFLIAAAVSLVFVGLVGRFLLAPLRAFGAGTPLGWVNSVLGLIPGAARGTAIAALLVIFAAMIPAELGLVIPLRDSRLAAPITRTGRDALGAALQWAGIDPGSTWILRQPDGFEDPTTPTIAAQSSSQSRSRPSSS